MAKIVIFVPNSPMLAQAEEIIAEKGLDAKAIFTDSEHVLGILKYEREQHGALVAVARGHHAQLIKEYTDMPLAEITINGQEMALLVSKAKTMCEHPEDLIAFVGFYNMFSDVKPIAQVLSANVKIYYAERSTDVPCVVESAIGDQAKIVIAGEKGIHYADSRGLKTCFLEPSKESLESAIAMARRICFGIELEKKQAARMLSVMDYTFDAMIQMDEQGVIRLANANAEQALHLSSTAMIGRYVYDVIQTQDDVMKRAIILRKEMHAAVVRIQNEEYITNLKVMGSENAPEGFVMTMQHYTHAREAENVPSVWAVRKEDHKQTDLNEYPSLHDLCLDAEQAAQHDLPVLLSGKPGTNREQLARYIHEASPRAEKVFVQLNLADLPLSMQESMFVVRRGVKASRTIVEEALFGTLYIEHVELLTPMAQACLCHICRHGWVLGENARPAFPVGCRVIAGTDIDLLSAVYEGKFSVDLYLELSRMMLCVPALDARDEDFEMLIDAKLREHGDRHKRTITLNSDVRELIRQCDWQGDETQMSAYIEKLVLMSPTSVVDLPLAKRIRGYCGISLREEQDISEKMETPALPQLKSEEAELITLSNRYRGNRGQMAKAMGISKTTLWRKLRKYNLITSEDETEDSSMQQLRLDDEQELQETI